MSEQRCLMTLVLTAYNQERYVREAVEGALSQTYEPLEVILSDDCSTDDTFASLREAASAYRGPHRVILNRNERNLGTGVHISRLMEMASGEFVVTGSGDDVAYPERVETVWSAWRADPRIFYVYTNFDRTYEGSELRKPFEPQTFYDDLWNMVPACGPKVIGCSAAWHRSCFDVFGPLPEGSMCEDRLIPFRAALLGRIAYVDTPTLHFRRHADSVSATIVPSRRSSFEDRRRVVRRRYDTRFEALDSFREDVVTAVEKDLIPPTSAKRLAAMIERTRVHEMDKCQTETGAWTARLTASLRILVSRSTPVPVARRRRLRYVMHAVFPFLERWSYDRELRQTLARPIEPDEVPW